MSDNWLQLVPADPHFQPSIEMAEGARTLFASFVPDADEVTYSLKDSIEFFHPMANWSGVECPSCGVDAEPWWEEAMQQGAQEIFNYLFVTSPCCNSRVSLNDLHYIWPATFGRFVLEAMNPNVSGLTPDQELALSQCLGSRVRTIWVHV